MNLFNMIGLILLAVVVGVTTTLKIVLVRRRKYFDKLHGYEDDEPQRTPADDWELF